MPATMSIIGLYHYDETIFDSLTVPEAMDKQNVIDTILMKCAAFEILYPDPDFMKEAIRIWSLGCAGVWDHLYETMHYEYNPIWNKDGTVTETNVHGAKKTTDAYGQDKLTTVNGAEHGETEESVAAFNSSSYANKSKTESDINSVTDSQTRDSRTDTHSDDSYTDTVTRIEKGNIGVTTTQQMIKEEREIAEFNLYDYIAEDFKNRFCLLVY